MAANNKIEISTRLLRSLHRIHQQRTELKSQNDRVPRQIAASQARVTKASEAVDDIKSRLQQARKTADEKQLQLKEREDRIVELKTKLNTAASNREFSTLQEQISADEQANDVLSDEIFEALELSDDISKELSQAETTLADESAENDKRIGEIKARQSVVEKDLVRVEQQLVDHEAEIPAAARQDYKRVTGAKGEDGLAPVEDESCGSCYQRLTTQVVEQLRMSKLTRCPNCDAFLYFPEDTRVR